MRTDDSLRYARERVHTTPVPASLVIRAERRRAIRESCLVALGCALLTFLLAGKPTDPPSGIVTSRPDQLLAMQEVSR